MHNSSIKVKNLIKEYEINSLDHKSFKNDLISFFGFNNFLKIHPLKNNKIIALNNLNFEINKGDIVALIGKNGAGKSTFIKILSSITEPTSGEIEYNGKLLAMLQVNAGLTGDCTARENIYFLSAMYGFSKNQIDEKIDDILEFGEIKKFDETPIKKFSGGMITRLVFSTVLNFKPDILIADEILANSDDNFKSKCIEKLKSLNDEGSTILFVSHEKQLIKKLCNYGILFEKGVTTQKLDIEECYGKYSEI